jgi:hypothetical protein
MWVVGYLIVISIKHQGGCLQRLQISNQVLVSNQKSGHNSKLNITWI